VGEGDRDPPCLEYLPSREAITGPSVERGYRHRRPRRCGTEHHCIQIGLCIGSSVGQNPVLRDAAFATLMYDHGQFEHHWPKPIRPRPSAPMLGAAARQSPPSCAETPVVRHGRHRSREISSSCLERFRHAELCWDNFVNSCKIVRGRRDRIRAVRTDPFFADFSTPRSNPTRGLGCHDCCGTSAFNSPLLLG